MRLGRIVLIYFVLGSMLWAGGAIQWNESGIATLFIQRPDNPQPDTQTGDQLSQLGGPIQEASSTVSGGALTALWNVLVKLIGFFGWPVIMLDANNAPPRVTVVVGGTFLVAFYMGVLRVFRQST